MKTKHPYNKQAKWTGGFFLAFVIGMTIWAGFLLNNYYISQSMWMESLNILDTVWINTLSINGNHNNSFCLVGVYSRVNHYYFVQFHRSPNSVLHIMRAMKLNKVIMIDSDILKDENGQVLYCETSDSGVEVCERREWNIVD